MSSFGTTANHFNVPILIFGCQRSGTTLLRTLLAEHPDLLVHPLEPQFLLNLLRRYGFSLHHQHKAVQELLEHPYLPEEIDRSALQAVLTQPAVRTWADLVNAYLSYWSSGMSDRKAIVLKDPAFTDHLPMLMHHIPHSHFIHIVRHPYGNVASQKSRWQDFSIWECAARWKEAVTIGRQFAYNNPDRCLEIRYDTLVLEPEKTLRQITNFLNIPYHPSMLNFSLDTTSFARGRQPQKKRFTSMDPARLTRWKQLLTSEDIRVIEACCQQEMSWWNFELLAPAVDQTALRKRVRKERWQYAFLRNGRALKRKLIQWKNRISP